MRNKVIMITSGILLTLLLLVSVFSHSSETAAEKGIEKGWEEDLYKYQPSIRLGAGETFAPVKMNFSEDWDIVKNKEKYEEKYREKKVSEVAREDSSVYCHKTDDVVNGVEYTRYTYVYYYAYNPFINTHFHDAEHVSVYVNKKTGEIDYVGTGEHNNKHFYHRDAVNFEGDTHPIVYVGVGSHSMVADRRDFNGITPSPYSPFFGDHCEKPVFAGTLPNVISLDDNNPDNPHPNGEDPYGLLDQNGYYEGTTWPNDVVSIVSFAWYQDGDDNHFTREHRSVNRPWYEPVIDKVGELEQIGRVVYNSVKGWFDRLWERGEPAKRPEREGKKGGLGHIRFWEEIK